MGLFDFLGDIVKEVANQSLEEFEKQRREQEERENQEVLECLNASIGIFTNINNDLETLYQMKYNEENAFKIFSSLTYYAALFSKDWVWFKQYYEPAMSEEDFEGFAEQIEFIIENFGQMFEEIPEDEEGAELYTEVSIRKESQRFCMKVKMLIDRLEEAQISERSAFDQIQGIIKHFSDKITVFTGNLLCFYLNGVDELLDE